MRWLDSITNSMDMNLSRLWDSEGQGSLVCCSSRGYKESDMTQQLNNNNHKYKNVMGNVDIMSEQMEILRTINYKKLIKLKFQIRKVQYLKGKVY